MKSPISSVVSSLLIGCVACQPSSTAPGEPAAPSHPVALPAQPATPASVPASAPPVTGLVAPDSVALRRFLPVGYRILDVATGDLNQDAYPDKLLVLDSIQTTSKTFGSEALRPLVVLLGNAQNTYRLAARNDHAVLCGGCGGVLGDPYQGLTIKNGYFSIEHYGGSSWRWTRIITFRYEPATQNWWLHRVGGETFHSSSPDSAKTYMQTTRDFGRVRFEQFTGEEGSED